MREGKTVLKKPSELHVLVHPHFSLTAGLETPAGSRSDFSTVGVRENSGRLFGSRGKVTLDAFSPSSDRIDEAGLKQIETMHRLYRKQIERIAKTPGAHLVVERDCRDSAKKEKPTTLASYLDSFEPRLIAFARRKLGKRVTFLNCHPADVGPQVAAIFHPTVKVNLFGEYNNSCVEVTRVSLLEQGYSVVLHKEKGVGV